MAEFTRDIKQLQQTASQSPTFSPPSKSLGGDIVNAIGTGLQFYAKNKAQNSLDAIAQKEMQDEQKFAEGVLKLREIRQTGENNTLSRTKRNSMETDFFKDYSPSMAMGILKATNTITGDTVSEIDTRMDAEAKAVKAETEEIDRASAAYASQFLGSTQQEISLLTPEQKEDYAKKFEVMTKEISIQKEIASVSENVTAPILSQARTILQPKLNAAMEKIEKAWKASDTEGAKLAGDNLINIINEATINAPAKIRELVGEEKKKFLNYGLINAYTAQIQSLLNDKRIKDIISGKAVSEEVLNEAKTKLDVVMSAQYFRAFKALENAGDGIAVKTDTDDLTNSVEYITGSKFGGVSFSGTKEKSLLRAIGYEEEAFSDTSGEGGNPIVKPPVALDILSNVINKTTNFIDNADVETISEGNALTQDYLMDKLDNDKELSTSDMQWVEDSLTYGNTGNIDKKGKGASKAVLGAPLSILARDDYKEKVKPAVDNAVSEGVDIISALTSSFDNHLRNNFNNAYTELVNLGVSGMAFAETTGIRIDRSKPSSQKGSYNLRDKIELQNINGSLNFKYKEGTLGQSTDATMVTNLMNLNASLVVVNDYVKAMSNVTGTEGKLVADEVMGLLNKYVNIPVESFTNEKQDYNLMASELGVDLSSYEDGDYELTNGKIITLKNGKVIGDK
jgi:hypothetical protein